MPSSPALVVIATMLGCVSHQSPASTDEGSPEAPAPSEGTSPSDGTSPSASPPAPIPACEHDLVPHLTRLGVPGLSAALIADGEIACTASAGLADVDSGRPVTGETGFLWASVSKTITATAAMMLVDEGLFELDDPIGDHLGFEVQNPRCASSPITFRQLLTHSSSIVDDDAVYDASYTIGSAVVPLGEFLEQYLSPDGRHYHPRRSFADHCPGEVNAYSNIAIGLLGYLVEQIAGVPFDELCRERIFEPLGMDETSFRLADLDPQRLAVPHQDGETIEHYENATYPDGGVRSSARHMARFLTMMAGGGRAPGAPRLLAEATAHEMRRVQDPALDDAQALVWFYDFGDYLGHDGGDDGASSLMFFDPETGAGALLVANGEWDETGRQESRAYALFEGLLEDAARH